ncbi:MAG TPA: hypothetical protein VEW48_15160 [Thermoanaerobaculia bacterium]|nr:hypothetical protein [Thermoanaerobaculia bacterium]
MSRLDPGDAHQEDRDEGCSAQSEHPAEHPPQSCWSASDRRCLAEADGFEGTHESPGEERGHAEIRPFDGEGQGEPEQATAQSAGEDGVAEDLAARGQPGRLEALDLEKGAVVLGQAAGQPGEEPPGPFRGMTPFRRWLCGGAAPVTVPGEAATQASGSFDLLPRPGELASRFQHAAHIVLEGPPDSGGPPGGEVLRRGILEGALEQSEHQRRDGQLTEPGVVRQGCAQPGERGIPSPSEMLVDLCRCEREQFHGGLELEMHRQLFIDLGVAGDRQAGGKAVALKMRVDRVDAAGPAARLDLVEAVEERQDLVARDPSGRLGTGLVTPFQLAGHPAGETAVLTLPGGQVEEDRYGDGGIAAGQPGEPAGELQEGDGLAAPRRPKKQQTLPLPQEDVVDRLDHLAGGSLRSRSLRGGPAHGIGPLLAADAQPSSLGDRLAQNAVDPEALDLVEESEQHVPLGRELDRLLALLPRGEGGEHARREAIRGREGLDDPLLADLPFEILQLARPVSPLAERCRPFLIVVEDETEDRLAAPLGFEQLQLRDRDRPIRRHEPVAPGVDAQEELGVHDLLQTGFERLLITGAERLHLARHIAGLAKAPADRFPEGNQILPGAGDEDCEGHDALSEMERLPRTLLIYRCSILEEHENHRAVSSRSSARTALGRASPGSAPCGLGASGGGGEHGRPGLFHLRCARVRGGQRRRGGAALGRGGRERPG